MSTLLEQLKEKMHKNFDDYRELVVSLDSETVFELSREIAAMQDVLFYMDTHDWVDEHEAAYLLDFTEPLKLVADAWEEHLDNGDHSFRYVLNAVLDNDENEENYITVALERELGEKHGYDISARDALILEIVETMDKCLELQERLANWEGGYCFEE